MKKHFITLIKVITFFALWVAAVSFSSAFTPISTPSFLNGNSALLRLWWELLPLLGVVLITGVFVLAVEKKFVTIPVFKNPLKSTAWGLCLGAAWIIATIFSLYLSGSLILGDKNEVSFLAIWFISVLLNAIMQELLIRGYLFSLLKDKYNLLVATAVTTVIFTAMHGGAFEAGVVAVFNVITMSVFVTLLLVYTESLLAPIIVHFIWNAIGQLVFGIVSLAEDYPSLWNGTLLGSELISGGAAKIEGSIFVSIVNVLLIILMCCLIRKRYKQV